MQSKITTFFKQNYIAIIIGLIFYFIYLQYTYAGNRMCGCETTEKYNASTSAYHRSTYRSGAGVNRFYHK
ncbi:hypothetical protein [Flavobacterium zepuense]|uniref:hypothetical protein n=1 Tax=Flavobacterium zepuense TaxID=2593302 RepID=UPI001F43CC2C|nr:hypothetical protein [Flavobacterium zepuense]